MIIEKMLEMQNLRRILKDNYIELPTRRVMQDRYKVLLDEFINQYNKLPLPPTNDPLQD
jgi:hypothetical protein